MFKERGPFRGLSYPDAGWDQGGFGGASPGTWGTDLTPDQLRNPKKCPS